MEADNTTTWNLTNNTNGTRPGSSGWFPRQMTTEDIVFDVSFCILALLIVFDNSLVIGAFHVNRRLRTTTNLLLMSLAIADMLVGLIAVPLWVYTSITYTDKGPVYEFFLMFDVISVVSSILHLTAVSLERCYALVWPIKHRNIRKRVVIAISCGAWILATLAGTTMEFLDEKNKKLYGVIVTAIFFFIPLIIILVAYGKIFQIARAHARGRGNSSFRKDLRIATTVAVVIGLFVICWTPFFAITFAFSVCSHKMWLSPGCLGLRELPEMILNILKLLFYGNSACNPIVYSLRNEEFRRAFRKILLGICCKKVRLTEYDKNAHGLHGRVRQVPNVHLQCEASFENLQQRSVTPSPQPPSGLFDMRRKSYCEGIQSESNNPLKLEILTTKSLAGDLQALNEDHANHTLPSDVPSASSLLTSTSAMAACSAELCNPVFEHDQTEETAGIYAIDQAIPSEKDSDMIGSKNCLQKRSIVKGTIQTIEAGVRCSLHRFKQPRPRKTRTIETRF